jgi:hypothetical protein
MKIIHVNVIERGRGVCLTAAMAVAVTLAQPFELVTAQAEDAAGVKAKDAPLAEDPAEVQRRQQVKQQATHWEHLLTRLLNGELEMIRAVSGDIPRDARRAIARAGEQAVKEAAVRLAELQFGGRKGEENTAGDPASWVSDSLAKSLAEHVGSPQAAAFTRQIAERSERRKAAAVHAIVAVLDGELFLTAKQREQIERSLLETWDDAMASSLEGMHWVDDRRVFPGLPADCISPHLSEAQRKRFAPQRNGGVGVVSQRQTWTRMNVLNNVPAPARDPWWFE